MATHRDAVISPPLGSSRSGLVRRCLVQLGISRPTRRLALLIASLLALSLTIHQGACESPVQPSQCDGYCDKCGCPEGRRCEQGLGDPIPVCRAVQ